MVFLTRVAVFLLSVFCGFHGCRGIGEGKDEVLRGSEKRMWSIARTGDNVVKFGENLQIYREFEG